MTMTIPEIAYGRRASDIQPIESPHLLPVVTELFGSEGYMAWSKAVTERDGGKFHDAMSDLAIEDVQRRGDVRAP